MTYTFTAAATGTIDAYFVGSTASFVNDIGVSVNGGPVSTFGLNNHTSAYGNTFTMASVNAGDTLVFVMHNISPGIGDLYSDPSLNGPYDGGGTHNHVYSTLFVNGGGGDPVPTGTFVSFEDLRANGPPNGPPDWNYNDEDFVFTNVATQSSAVPVPPGLALAGIGVSSLLGYGWRRKKAA